MAQCDDRPVTTARRRGRPVNSDSAETRNRILRASRQVINERGYQAATFQSIAVAAGLSRPTLHYYFASREEIFQALIVEATVVVADVVAEAQRPSTLLEQFAALATAIHRADFRDRSQLAFLVSARLESTRNPELRPFAENGLYDCLTTLVAAAHARGELSEDAEVEPVVDVLHAMLLGVAFYAGFVQDAADVHSMATQLVRTVSFGLPSSGTNSSTRGDTKDDTPSVVGGQQ